jgi:hypothetical protein
MEYREFISFVDVGGPDAAFLDPKDAPYIKLQQQIGALIYSRDEHIKKMNGVVVSAAVVASLRIYSRQVVVEYALKMGGTGCICISFGLIKLMSKFVHAILGGARRIPKKFWILALTLLLGVLIYPPSRRYLINSINSFSGRTKVIGTEMLDQFAHLLGEHETAKAKASAALSTVHKEIDQYPDYVTLLQRS